MASLLAQDKVRDIDAGLKQQYFYASLPATYYVAVLPIQGCFSCEVFMNNQIKALGNNDKIIMIYPSARKIVQEKIIKENTLDNARARYIFEDKVYRQFYDNKKPKGYIKQVRKS